MNYKGVIIEESLENKDILKGVAILATKVESVIKKHKTPWLKQWTLHTVGVVEDKGDEVAEKISESLDCVKPGFTQQSFGGYMGVAYVSHLIHSYCELSHRGCGTWRRSRSTSLAFCLKFAKLG